MGLFFSKLCRHVLALMMGVGMFGPVVAHAVGEIAQWSLWIFGFAFFMFPWVGWMVTVDAHGREMSRLREHMDGLYMAKGRGDAGD